jgi:hypothetical protein
MGGSNLTGSKKFPPLKDLLPGDLFRAGYMNVWNTEERTYFGIFLSSETTKWSKGCSFITMLTHDGIVDKVLFSPKDRVEILARRSNECR